MAHSTVGQTPKVDNKALAEQMAAALQSVPSSGSYLHLPDEHVPSEIEEWLINLGWNANRNTYPNDHMTFNKPDCYDGLYMTWSEAVSCEFFRFLTLGSTGRRRESMGGEAMANVGSSPG